MQKNKNILGYSLEDINNRNDEQIELSRKLKNSKNYAKTLLWIANKFFNENKPHFDNKEFSRFMKKIPQETTYLLNIFVNFGMIKAIRRGHFRATIYTLNDGELLRTSVNVAKETLGISKKDTKTTQQNTQENTY